ncbi:MAG: hypothetical protein H6Q15_860 [Bacteroidetes bacterium]|nr:hypothetical protein [Bacteroidota bacterium]
MDIFSVIKERRDLLGVTQQELSEISGISLKTIIQIENKKANPSFNTLSKIVDVLGMEITLRIKTK